MYTEYVYDALGRTTQVKHPPVTGSTGTSGTTTYSYSGNQVTVTDPAGRYKRFTTNAFGNLTWVVEPKAQGPGEYATANDYNLLDKLTAVTMVRDGATQIRTFGYNAQQRLSSVTLPETGTTSYTYNTDGTLLRRSDAKGQKVEYEYDVYKRVRKVNRYKAGSSTPDPCQTVSLWYDVTKVTDKSGQSKVLDRLVEATWGDVGTVCPAGLLSEQLAYNAAGLVTAKRLIVSKDSGGNGVLTGSLDAYFTYDSEGRPREEYYPNNGPQLDTVYAPHGRADHKYRWQIGQLNTFVAMNARYNAAGQMTNLLVLNSHNQTFSYNGRNQLTEHKVQASGGGAVHLHTRYSYAAANDGRLWKQQDVLSGEEVTYTYDALARLVKAETNNVAGAWGQAYDYDGFGNQYAQRVVKGSAPYFSLTPNSATNRIAQFAYDANGNVTNDGTRGYSYDVENRLEANELGQRYSYGPDNRRVWDGTGYVFWSPDGKRIGRYTMQAAWSQAGWSYVFQTVRTNVYFAGRLIGQSDAAPGTTFVPVVTDRLGSVRLRGGTAMNYFPFGDERVVTAQGQEKFGTYLRDSNGLDYADQRYYASRYARFMTADPSDTAKPSDPDSWNRYAYVQGDPVNFSDPSGEILVAPDGGGGSGIIPFPITFIAWGIGKILGLGRPSRITVDRPWRDDLGGQVAQWNARIAQSEEDAKQSGARYVAALKVTFDCYTRSQFGPYIRRFTYQAIDQSGAPFNRGEYVAFEQHHVVQGEGALIAGGVWGYGQQRPDGTFFDYIGKLFLSKDVLTYQTFTVAQTTGPLAGLARPVPVYYPNYGSEWYGVMGHLIGTTQVRTHQYYYNPLTGRVTCPDQPVFRF